MTDDLIKDIIVQVVGGGQNVNKQATSRLNDLFNQKRANAYKSGVEPAQTKIMRKKDQ